MDVEITTVAERPGLRDLLWFPDTWPEFMGHDPVGAAYFGRIAETFPDFTLVATDDTGEVVARGHSVPFALRVPGRGTLPATGWDQVLLWAFADHRRGVTPDTVSAVEIAFRADRLGRGLSGTMLAAMRDAARSRGFGELVAPVRPTSKQLEPATSMRDYAFRTRPDGLPHDPWLRTHARAGAVIDSVAPASMTISGSLPQWRTWTGLSFDSPGWTDVPGALTPVLCVPEQDYAVYVEPNVWMRHALGTGG
jgi:hypothetical protein